MKHAHGEIAGDGGANFPDMIDRALRASKAVLCF
jgi:hypothetical protein